MLPTCRSPLGDGANRTRTGRPGGADVAADVMPRCCQTSPTTARNIRCPLPAGVAQGAMRSEVLHEVMGRDAHPLPMVEAVGVEVAHAGLQRQAPASRGSSAVLELG